MTLEPTLAASLCTPSSVGTNPTSRATRRWRSRRSRSARARRRPIAGVAAAMRVQHDTPLVRSCGQRAPAYVRLPSHERRRGNGLSARSARGDHHDPAEVSGAVLLLPIQLNVLHVPSPTVTPTNLLFNVATTPGGLPAAAVSSLTTLLLFCLQTRSGLGAIWCRTPWVLVLGYRARRGAGSGTVAGTAPQQPVNRCGLRRGRVLRVRVRLAGARRQRFLWRPSSPSR